MIWSQSVLITIFKSYASDAFLKSAAAEINDCVTSSRLMREVVVSVEAMSSKSTCCSLRPCFMIVELLKMFFVSSVFQFVIA